MVGITDHGSGRVVIMDQIKEGNSNKLGRIIMNQIREGIRWRTRAMIR